MILDFITGWFGLGAIIAVAAIAVAVLLPPWLAVFIPNLRIAAIAVAVIAGACSTIYAKGYFDGTDAVKQEVKEELEDAIEDADKARRDAVRDIERKPAPSLRDKHNRDR